MEEKTLATELLAEVKAQSRRWFVISIIEAIMIFIMIIFIVTTPVVEDEIYTQEANGNDNASISQSIGE